MTTIHRIRTRLFADFYQFYLMDGGIAPDAPEDWTEEDYSNRAKVADNVVVIAPVRNTYVTVTCEIRTAEPLLRVEEFDHALEGSIDLPTGYLQLHECTGEEVIHLSVEPGTYQFSAWFSRLGSLTDNGWDGDDTYHIYLWRGPARPLLVRRRWTGAP
jgi:hypothetical protein